MAIFSMTGYGRGESVEGSPPCVVEIRSVNNRYMEVSAKLPKRFSAWADPIRKTMKKHFSRGSFDISVSFNGGENSSETALKPNLVLARQFLRSVETLKKELGLEGKATFDQLLALKDIFIYEGTEDDKDLFGRALEETLEKAIQALKEMRAAEGEALAADISRRLEVVLAKAERIKGEQPRIVREYRERLLERIRQIADEIKVDPGRIAQEAAVFAERADISEEAQRLECHLEQFKKHLNSGGAVGRKLDFILQEMNRETNTLLSKVPDYSCSEEAIEIKCELEKIREQVQNIE